MTEFPKSFGSKTRIKGRVSHWHKTPRKATLLNISIVRPRGITETDFAINPGLWRPRLGLEFGGLFRESPRFPMRAPRSHDRPTRIVNASFTVAVVKRLTNSFHRDFVVTPGVHTMSSTRLSSGSDEHRSTKTLRKGFTFFVATCIVATIGYVSAGWEWLDAIYMVTITIFGVGYGEVRPIEEPWLKLFTIGVIFAGCSSLIYVIGGIVQMLAEGEIERMLGVRTRSREIEQLSDHTIVCGYGRFGQMLAAELANQGERLVVLDRESMRASQAIEDGFLAMQGDAVDDDALQQAGLFRAKTLATVLPDDATNVFITLTAREMSDTIRIIARAESPCTERKLLRSGASSVVMPAAIGAVRIAQLATAQECEDPALPEKRYRMLKATACKSQPEADDVEGVQAVQEEIEELANLATDLTRSVAERHQDQLAAKNK